MVFTNCLTNTDKTNIMMRMLDVATFRSRNKSRAFFSTSGILKSSPYREHQVKMADT